MNDMIDRIADIASVARGAAGVGLGVREGARAVSCLCWVWPCGVCESGSVLAGGCCGCRARLTVSVRAPRIGTV